MHLAAGLELADKVAEYAKTASAGINTIACFINHASAEPELKPRSQSPTPRSLLRLRRRLGTVSAPASSCLVQSARLVLAVALDLDFLLFFRILAVVAAIALMLRDRAKALRVATLFFVCHSGSPLLHKVVAADVLGLAAFSTGRRSACHSSIRISYTACPCNFRIVQN